MAMSAAQDARKEGRSYHFGMGLVMVPNCDAIAHTAIRQSSGSIKVGRWARTSLRLR